MQSETECVARQPIGVRRATREGDDGMKRSSARPRGRLSDSGSRLSKSARLRDNVSANASRLRSNPKRKIGGTFSKSRAMPAQMKFVVLIDVKYGDAILTA